MTASCYYYSSNKHGKKKCPPMFQYDMPFEFCNIILDSNIPYNK